MQGNDESIVPQNNASASSQLTRVSRRRMARNVGHQEVADLAEHHDHPAPPAK